MNRTVNLEYEVYNDVTILNLIIAVTLILVAIIISKIISMYIKRAIKDKMSKDYFRILIKIINSIIIFIVILSVLPLLGVNLAGLLVAGGIVALIIGFASQNTVSNLIAGIFLMIDRSVKIGDSIKVDDTSGVIEDISIITTAVRTFDGLYVRIPNEKVFNNSITNYVVYIARRFDYTFRIRHCDDAERALEIIGDLVEEHPFALKAPAPLIYIDEIGESAVVIIAKIWGPVSEWFSVKKELIWKIKKGLENEGIEIAMSRHLVRLENEATDNAGKDCVR